MKQAPPSRQRRLFCHKSTPPRTPAAPLVAVKIAAVTPLSTNRCIGRACNCSAGPSIFPHPLNIRRCRRACHEPRAGKGSGAPAQRRRTHPGAGLSIPDADRRPGRASERKELSNWFRVASAPLETLARCAVVACAPHSSAVFEAGSRVGGPTRGPLGRTWPRCAGVLPEAAAGRNVGALLRRTPPPLRRIARHRNAIGRCAPGASTGMNSWPSAHSTSSR